MREVEGREREVRGFRRGWSWFALSSQLHGEHRSGIAPPDRPRSAAPDTPAIRSRL